MIFIESTRTCQRCTIIIEIEERESIQDHFIDMSSMLSSESNRNENIFHLAMYNNDREIYNIARITSMSPAMQDPSRVFIFSRLFNCDKISVEL